MRRKVYEKNPKTVNELKDYIHDEFRETDENWNLCCTVCQVFWRGVKNVAMIPEDLLSIREIK